ncbi:MAG TPA: SDR family oxidoreductase [Acidimicrobiales bacterium]|nr:SDR family oxidoreductase [Acidimicrobiales bacterium]
MIADLEGRAAVVTGAASGIGRAAAMAFAQHGMRTVLADINDERLDKAVEEIRGAGGEGIAVHCDVASDDDLAALHRAARQSYGPVDLVMSNVGVLVLGEPADIPIDAWQRVLDIDLLSVVRATREFLPSMLERGSGHLVNTALTAGLWGYGAERLPYVAAKAAIVAVSEALAAYARPKGVGVTCLCPGPVATNIAEQMTIHGPVGNLWGPPLEILEPAVVAAQVVDAVRTGRFFVPTHDEVFGILRRRAEDPEGFLDEIIAQRSSTTGAG